DARLALDDRDDTLVVLDRGEPRDLHLVDVANENAPRLRLGDELVDRTGAEAPVLGDVQPANVATGTDRLEDRVRPGDRLAGGRVRRCGRAHARCDAADLLGVALLAATRTAAPAAGALALSRSAPALSTALALRLPALVRAELARLLAVLSRCELLLRTERLRSELRALPAELRARSREGRTRSAKSAATASAATAPSTAAAIGVGIGRELRLRGLRRSRIRVGAWRRWCL